ncbi:TfoX/Sxy family protein [Streptomyces sp. ms184]|uniref:TfoX/Sxy family protein n=1 Tax=Streptomyces sp. ms184 TaxID=1827974 RepID=UPI00211D690F|nr:TfoX/Sxy family protein [Streptomyces sp. ms184]
MAGPDLPERVRAALGDRRTREVKMFGGISFMVDERMVAAARGDGDLLLRIDPARREDLLARPGAHEALMGEGRSMGPGWLAVDEAALTGAGLAEWLGHALDFREPD